MRPHAITIGMLTADMVLTPSIRNLDPRHPLIDSTAVMHITAAISSLARVVCRGDLLHYKVCVGNIRSSHPITSLAIRDLNLGPTSRICHTRPLSRLILQSRGTIWRGLTAGSLHRSHHYAR